LEIGNQDVPAVCSGWIEDLPGADTEGETFQKARNNPIRPNIDVRRERGEMSYGRLFPMALG